MNSGRQGRHLPTSATHLQQATTARCVCRRQILPRQCLHHAHAFAAQAIEMLADSTARASARARLYALLVEIEEPNGGWNDRVFARSRAFGTAMIVMALLQPQASARPVWSAPEDATESKGK